MLKNRPDLEPGKSKLRLKWFMYPDAVRPKVIRNIRTAEHDPEYIKKLNAEKAAGDVEVSKECLTVA